MRNMFEITRKIFQMGKYSYAITLSKEVIKALGWREKQILEIVPDLKNKRLIIKDYKI